MLRRPLQSHVFSVGFFSRWYRLARPLVRAYVILFFLLAVLFGLWELDWKFKALRELLTPRYLAFALGATAASLLAVVMATFWVFHARRNIIVNISRDMSQQRTFNLPSFLTDISPSLRRFLHGFAEHEEAFREAPYILLRNACHHRQVYFWPFVRRGEWFRDPLLRRQDARFEVRKQSALDTINDVLVTKIARALDVDIKPIFGEGTWFEDMITDIRKQKSILDDGGDLPLRYVQATPQKRFVDHSVDDPVTHRALHDQPLDGELPKAKYIIMCCLTNPIKDPVYILPVAAVVERLRTMFPARAGDYIATLLKQVTPVFWGIKPGERNSEIADDVMELYHRYDRQILSRLGDAYRASFDANKIDYSQMADRVEARKAIFAFTQAMDAATDEEIKIKLRPGDILILSNYYGMHRRIELGYMTRRPLFFAKRRRWLRVYYAFSHPDIV